MSLVDTIDDRSTKDVTRTANRAIGLQLKKARQHRGWSQEKLGAALGVTFQQLQKYEKGGNRISAGTLQVAAAALDLPITFFFPPLSAGSTFDRDQARAA